MVTINLNANDSAGEDSGAISLIAKLKFLEEERVKSFKDWQYAANENCSVKKVCSSDLCNFLHPNS